jgi:hypothetical protein
MYVIALDKHIQDGYGDQVALFMIHQLPKPFENTLF